MPQGSEIGDIDKRRIKRGTLSFQKSDTQELKYSEPFTIRGRAFTFLEPLSIRIETRGQILILLCDVFSIVVDSPDNNELYRNFEEALYNYYMSTVINNRTSAEAKTFNIYFEVRP